MSVCEIVFKFGWLQYCAKRPKREYRVCKGKINAYETGQFGSTHLKQTKQNTRGAHVKSDRPRPGQDSHSACTRPKSWAGERVPCRMVRTRWPLGLPSAQGVQSCPWRWGKKLSPRICRVYGHLCSAPSEICFIFGEKKMPKQLASVCFLLPFKPIKYLSLNILSIQI